MFMMVFCNLFITKTLDEINQQQDKGIYYLPFKCKRVTPYLGITWFNLKIPLVLSPSGHKCSLLSGLMIFSCQILKMLFRDTQSQPMSPDNPQLGNPSTVVYCAVSVL